MPDLLQTGSDWLAAQFKAHAAQPVTYRRGASEVTLQTTIGRTKFEAADEQGIVIEQQVRDYLIAAADLNFGAGPVLPQRGDRIHETEGTAVHVYEVLPLGPDGEMWRYSDPYRRTLRIHAKHVGIE